MSNLYRINPVKAVTKLGYSKRDIIGPSDKCYSICAAFSSGDDAYHIDPDCAKSCNEFVEKRRREVYGVGKCDHQAPYRPVIWNNIPSYVGILTKKGKSPEEALKLGKEMCRNVPGLYNECVDMCNLHYDSIEKISEDNKREVVKGDDRPVVDQGDNPDVEEGVKEGVVTNVIEDPVKEGYKRGRYSKDFCVNMFMGGVIIFLLCLVLFNV